MKVLSATILINIVEPVYEHTADVSSVLSNRNFRSLSCIWHLVFRTQTRSGIRPLPYMDVSNSRISYTVRVALNHIVIDHRKPLYNNVYRKLMTKPQNLNQAKAGIPIISMNSFTIFFYSSMEFG
jgi:hypothetical protein